MNRRPSPELRVHRAHVIRLAKRAVKRDRIVVMCSWNISALAVELITDTELPLPERAGSVLRRSRQGHRADD